MAFTSAQKFVSICGLAYLSDRASKSSRRAHPVLLIATPIPPKFWTVVENAVAMEEGDITSRERGRLLYVMGRSVGVAGLRFRLRATWVPPMFPTTET